MEAIIADVTIGKIAASNSNFLKIGGLFESTLNYIAKI